MTFIALLITLKALFLTVWHSFGSIAALIWDGLRIIGPCVTLGINVISILAKLVLLIAKHTMPVFFGIAVVSSSVYLLYAIVKRLLQMWKQRRCARNQQLIPGTRSDDGTSTQPDFTSIHNTASGVLPSSNAAKWLWQRDSVIMHYDAHQETSHDGLQTSQPSRIEYSRERAAGHGDQQIGRSYSTFATSAV